MVVGGLSTLPELKTAMTTGAEFTAERLIRSLREEQDAEGVRAFLAALGAQDVSTQVSMFLKSPTPVHVVMPLCNNCMYLGSQLEGLIQLFRRLVSRSDRAAIHVEDLLAVLLTSNRTNVSTVDLCLEVRSAERIRSFPLPCCPRE